MLVLLAVSGCTGVATTGDTDAIGTAPIGSDFRIVAEPGHGATEVSPIQPVRLTVTDGTLTSVTLTNPAGKQVQGRHSDDDTTWTVTEPLGFAKTYTWSGEAVDSAAERYPISGSFTTVAPDALVSARSNVGDGGTYGIAMPISITFSEKITDKAAVERMLRVKTEPKTEGSWAWLENDTAVHWRPKKYWKPGTEVHVEVPIYGVRTSEGRYGAHDLTVDFSIGRAQIVRGDTTTHRMVVIRDGKQVADYPASYGLDSDAGRVTRSGTHVVMSKHPTYFMNNARYDYEDFEVNWAVRISNNGEFTHSAPWSVGDQGKRNVSHGCINLAPADAKEYYDSALIGDPVEITGSDQRLTWRDGAYHDWTYSWSRWQEMSALTE
ncbi:MAG: L,D-transpeptidase [Haloechinothrix sp.]